MIKRYVMGALLGWLLSTQAYGQALTVNYCAQQNWMPYEGVRNNKHIGLVADYMAVLSQLTGVRFVPVITSNWQQSLEFLAAGQCDITVTVDHLDPSRQSMAVTQRFFSIPHVLVTPAKTTLLTGYAGLGERRTGVVDDFYHDEYVRRYYPGVQLIEVQSEQEGLAMLQDGELDAMIASLLSVNSFLKKLNKTGLVIAGGAEPVSSLRFAVAGPQRDELVGLLNRAIQTIPQSQRVEIYQRWNQVVVHQQGVWLYIVAAVVILAAIAVLLYWVRHKVGRLAELLKSKTRELDAMQAVVLDKNRTIEFLSNHDADSGLYNRNHIILKAEEEIARFKRFNSPASLVVLDFMTIEVHSPNGHGHTDAGLIRMLGRACLSSIREVDVLARWSPEQLVFLCPQTKQGDGSLLAERLIDCIEQTGKEHGVTIKVAAGIAGLRDNWSFNDWYEQACSVLYHARRQGGGVVNYDFY